MSKLSMISDGLRSMLGGLGNISRDKSAASDYTVVHLSEYQIISAYRTSWVIRKLIDLPATDVFRKGRDWQGDTDQVQAISTLEEDLCLFKKASEAIIKADLFGGSIIYIGTDQDPEEPFEPEKVQKDGVKFLTVIPSCNLSSFEINQDPTDSNYGNSDYYQINNSTNLLKIHHTHCIRFIGNEHPTDFLQDDVNTINQGFGDSVLQTIYETAKQSDTTNANIASLIFEANVDVIRKPDFLNNLGDSAYEQKMISRYSLAAAGKGINGTLMLDKEEEYDRKNANFSNLDQMMYTFVAFAAASRDIPITKFLGKSAEGMNSTGEGDQLNYYDMLQTKQTMEITPAMRLFDEALVRSALGDYPEDINYKWTPFKQLSEKEVVETAEKVANTVEKLNNTGLFSPEALQQSTINQLVQVGAFSGIDNLSEESDIDLDDKSESS